MQASGCNFTKDLKIFKWIKKWCNQLNIISGVFKHYLCYKHSFKIKNNIIVVGRAVGLETNFLWSQSWSRLFCTGLGLEPLWSRSRSSKIGLETG